MEYFLERPVLVGMLVAILAMVVWIIWNEFRIWKYGRELRILQIKMLAQMDSDLQKMSRGKSGHD